MKKFFNLVASLALVAMSATMFTACDEEVKGKPNPEKKEEKAKEDKNINPADKFEKKHDTALLLVTFGSTFDVPEKTFEAQKAYFAKAYPNTDLYMSFTSRTIINRLQAQNRFFIPPAMWLKSFLGKGYKNVYVQSFHVIPGEEYTLLRDAYVKKEYNVYLKDKREGRNFAVLGEPLLSSKEDIQKVAKILVDDNAEALKKGEVVAFMGHGNPEENYRYANQRYIDLQDEMQKYAKATYNNDFVYVATVDFPERLFDYLLGELAKIEGKLGKDGKKITLQPLMTIVGDHANNDMAGDEDPDEKAEDQSWKVQLSKKGWTVTTRMKGLGDYEAINAIYLEHLKAAIANMGKEE